MNLKQLMLILWSRKTTIGVVFLAVVLAALVGVYRVEPQYQARAQVFANLSDANAATLNQVSVSASRTYVNSQVEAARSRGTALAVVRNLGLSDDPAMIQAFQASGERGDIADWIAGGIQRGLEVNRQGLSDIITLNYRSPNPESAARMANAFADALIQREVHMRVQPAVESVRLLEERLTALRERFAEGEAQRSQLRLEAIRRGEVDAAGLVDPNASVPTVLAQARAGVIQARTALELARSGQNPPVDNIEIASLRRSLADVEVSLQRETPLLGPTHRRIQALTTNAEQLRAQVRTATARLRADLLAERERELLAAQRRVEEAQGLLARDETQRNDQTRSRSAAASLDRELEGLKAQIETLVQRRERGIVESGASVSNLSILTRASTPSDPAWPRIPIVISVALALGAAFGSALAFLREMIDRRVRCVDDLRSYIDAPILGEVLGARLAHGKQALPKVAVQRWRGATFGRSSPALLDAPSHAGV